MKLNELKKCDAAYLFINGQSNAHGHGQNMSQEDYIRTPLKNVFALDRTPNQSYDIDDVVWSGFTTAGKNLGETQDNTYSFAYYFAKMWQAAIEQGVQLPDLYIVQISIGAQGIINGMWNKHKEKILISGVLGEANISLYDFASRIHSLVLKDMRKRFDNPAIIGWHWIGSEQDTLPLEYDYSDFLELYDDFFDNMLGLANTNCPAYLYKLVCFHHERFAKGIEMINNTFNRECKRHENFTLVETDKSPIWDGDAENSGVFDIDNVHYLPKAQRWFAENFFHAIIK